MKTETLIALALLGLGAYLVYRQYSPPTHSDWRRIFAGLPREQTYSDRKAARPDLDITVAGGTIQGLAIGSSFGPWGALAGAGGGAVAGLIV